MSRKLAASQRRLSLSSSLTSTSLAQSMSSSSASTLASPTKLLVQRSPEPAGVTAGLLPTCSDTADSAPLTSPVRVLEKQPKSAQTTGRRTSHSSSPPAVRDELPILRSQYVARDVKALIGRRWKLNKFATKTVVLHPNGSSPMCGATAAQPVLRVCSAASVETAGEDAQQFTLTLDLKCVRSGPNELKLKGTGSGGDAFRMKIRFATAADAGIWLKLLRDALAHARWVRDVEETACLSRDVRVVRHTPSKQEFVVKVLPSVRVDGMLNAEILVLKKLFASAALPHIREYRVVETPTDTCVVMPKLPGRNLLEFLRQSSNPRHHYQKLSEADARAVMRGLCDALHSLHQVGIVHCDLKLENILLTDVSDVRVIDFGGAFDITAAADGWKKNPRWTRAAALPSVPHRMVGTPGYIAPERILFVDLPPTPAADVFSAGIVLFQMLTGRQPFVRPSRRRALSMQDTTVLHWHVAEKILSHHGVSAAATALIERMVDPDPHARITVEEIVCDPWLR